METIIDLVKCCKGTLLKEERGVGASRKYLDAVKEIVDYVASEVKYEKSSNGKWNILIPKQLTEKFDIFDKLNIEVIIEDIGPKAKNISGSGGTNVLTQNINKFKLGNNDKAVFSVPVDIYVEGYSDGNILVRKTVACSLVHELNHKIDEYSRATKSGELVSSLFTQGKAYLAAEKFLGKYISEIVYRLFSESELNALIASVYGDLEGMNSKREDFDIDIEELQAYWVWRDIEYNLYRLDRLNEKNWEEIVLFFKTFNVLSPLPKEQNPTPRKMKQAFISKTKKELDKLKRGIGRVASYYYDMSEESVTEIMTR